jgi:tetratricopeptide (TPR) repeat protein
MAALLDALTHDPRHKLRKAGVVAGLSAVGIASLALMFTAGAAQSRAKIAARPNPCSAANDRVAEVWNPHRREALRETFAGTHEAWAATLAAEVEAGLTRWATTWTAMHRSTCEASARGEQSDSMLDRRMLCLDRRLAQFDALVEVVGGSQAQTLARAGEAVRKLPDLSACEAEAIEPAGTPGREDQPDAPVNELERLILDDLERDLFRANTLEMTGAFAEATALVDAALDRARAFSDRRLIVTALLVRARIARARGQLETVAVALEEAGLVAERAGDDRLRGAVMIARARAEWEAGEPEAAGVRVREARAVLDRVGASPLEFAVLDAIAARTAATPTQLAEAELDVRAAIDEVSRAPDPSGVAPVELAELQTSLGVVLRERGQFGEARVELEQAARVWAAHYGAQHPVLVSVGFELALVDQRAGRFEAALAGYAAVLPSFERAYGRNSLEVGRTSEAMAVVLAELGRFDEALRHHQRARAIFRAALASEGVGRRLAARALAEALANEGVVRRALGQLDEALSLQQQGLSLLDRDWSVDARASSRPGMLVDLAQILLDLDRGIEARAPIDEALQLLTSSSTSAEPVGDRALARARAQFIAAQAWAAEPEPERARARGLAREARKAFANANQPETVAEVEAWLAQLDGRHGP